MIVTRLRVRVLLFAFVASQVVSLLAISVVWPEWLTAKPSLRFPEAVAGLLAYAGLFGWLAWMFARRGDSIRELFGPLPASREMTWAAGMGVGLVGLAMAAFTLLYLPLSYLFPDYVEWMLDNPPIITWSGPAFHAAPPVETRSAPRWYRLMLPPLSCPGLTHQASWRRRSWPFEVPRSRSSA